MDRYRLFKHMVVGSGADQTIEGKMIECPEGEWVKWEDLLRKLMQCNCEDIYLHRFPEYPAYWFCPAHGYKKR